MATNLLENKASLMARETSGRTPLIVAANAGRSEAVECLADCDVELDAADADGDTALHVAAAGGHAETVTILLQYGANVMLQNGDGDQAAHVAARFGHAAVMHSLMEYDAPMGRRNWAELTPIGAARMANQTHIVDLLTSELSPEALGLFEDGEAVEPPAWDRQVAEVRDDWGQVWDEAEQLTVWRNARTGELSTKPPEFSESGVVALRDDRPEMAYKHKVHAAEATDKPELGVAQYREFVAKENEEIRVARAELLDVAADDL